MSSAEDPNADLFIRECEGCGNEFDARDEKAEDHEEDCPVLEAYAEMWGWIDDA